MSAMGSYIERYLTDDNDPLQAFVVHVRYRLRVFRQEYCTQAVLS